MKNFKKIFLVLLLGIFVIPSFLFAAVGGTNEPNGGTTIPNPFKGGSDLNSLIVSILNNVVMPIAAVASVLYIIWAGFQYVQARGNPGEITKANKNLMWALIGVGVLLGAAGISEVVQNTIKSLIQVN